MVELYEGRVPPPSSCSLDSLGVLLGRRRQRRRGFPAARPPRLQFWDQYYLSEMTQSSSRPAVKKTIVPCEFRQGVY